MKIKRLIKSIILALGSVADQGHWTCNAGLKGHAEDNSDE